MNPEQIALYVIRDMLNLRVAAAVLAGAITLAVATMISILCLVFSANVTILLQNVIEPTTPVTGILRVTPQTLSGRFSHQGFESLMTRIKEFQPDSQNLKTPRLSALHPLNEPRNYFDPSLTIEEAKPEISSVSMVVTAFSNNVFRFLDHVGSDLSKPGGVSVWSMPKNSSFLEESENVRYVLGKTFAESDKERHTKLSTKPYRPRLGVIVNEKFLRYYLNMKPEEWDARFEAKNFRYPNSILLGFHRTSADGQGRPSHINLAITGVVNLNHEFYPDLFFNEDMARAYFLDSVITDALGKKNVFGEFPGEFAHRFDQWETGEPLESPPKEEPSGYFPTELLNLDYKELREIKDEPYDLLILKVSNWHAEYALQQARDAINSMTSQIDLDSKDGSIISGLAKRAARRDTQLQSVEENINGKVDAGNLDLTNARIRLRNIIVDQLSAKIDNFQLSRHFLVSESAGDGSYDIEDDITGTFVRIEQRSGTGHRRILTYPPWEAEEVMDLTLRRTILRLKGIIETYSTVMFVIVLILVVSTSLLMSFGHVFHKRRDIGILLTNGASQYSVVLIYLGEIVLLTCLGALVGIALAYFAAPLIEERAAETIRDFLKLAALEGTLEVGTLLGPNMLATLRALGWVGPAAFVGALYPVIACVRVPPHQSVATGA